MTRDERRELKKRARASLKAHYTVFVIVSILAVFMGTEPTLTRELYRQNLSLSGTAAAGDTATSSKAADLEELGFSGSANLRDSVSGSSAADFAEEILQNHFESAYDRLESAEKDIDGSLENIGAGGLRSAVSMALRSLLSGDASLRLAEAVYGFMETDSTAIRILIPLAFLLYAFIWIFVLNLIEAATCRVFLEGREYRKTGLSRLLYVYRMHAEGKAARAMLLRTIYQLLWNFTIVGGVIKRYSYFMVPSIVAECPNMGARDAISLSRQMMQGHKVEAFKLELSFSTEGYAQRAF